MQKLLYSSSSEKILHLHAVALLRKGNISEAISQLKKAIELKPDYADAHNTLGVALQKKGNTSEAISHYKRAVALNPDYAQAHSNLKIALLKLVKIEGF